MPSISGIKAGNAYVVIGALDDTGKMLSKIGRNIKKWGSGLQNLGLDMLFKGAFAALPGIAMMKWATEFDDNMTSVAAKIGATNAEMNTLRQTAKTAGNDIGMTAKQISEIMLELSTRDFDAAAINQMARPIALLAKATGSGSEKDTKQAAALLSQTLQAFSMNAADAAMVADKMTIAANKSNFALDDMAVAMSHVAPIAAQMNVSLDDTIAIMSVMRNVGIEAESAAIGFRNIMLRTTDLKKGKEFNDTMKAMGLEVVEFATKAGNMKNPVQIISDVFDRIENLGTQGQANVLSDLMGLRAIVPAAAAGRGLMGIEEMRAALKNLNNDAEKIAQAMEEGSGGAWRLMRNAVEAVGNVLNNNFLPVLKEVAAFVWDTSVKIINWIKKNQTLTNSIILSSVAVVGLGVSLVALGYTIKIIGSAIAGFGMLLTGLKVALTVVVMAFTIGFAIISGAIGIIIPVITTVVSMLATIITTVWTIAAAIVSFVASIAGIPAAILAGLVVFLAAMALLAVTIVTIVQNFKEIWQIGVGAFNAMKTAAGEFGNFLMGVWQRIGIAGVAVFGFLKEGLGAAFKLAAVGKFQLAMEVAIASLKVSWLEIRNVVMDVWDQIASFILTKINKIVSSVKGMVIDTQVAFQKIGIFMAIDKGEITKEQGKAMFAALNKEAAARKGLLPGEVKPDEEARGKRFQEKQDAHLAFMNKMKEVAPDLAEADQVLADLKNQINNLLNFKIPDIKKENGLEGKPPPAITALEKGSIEAAKAAYEASVAGELSGDVQQRQLGVLQEVATNTGIIAANLGVA